MAMKSSITKDFSLDVVYEVLVRLPVKTLIRFRSVCKPWNSLISSLCFEQDHYRRRQRNPLFLALEKAGDCLLPSSYSNIKNSEEGFTLVNKLSLKVPNTAALCKIQSCLGLVCIVPMENSIFILNPVSGEHIALPPTEGFNVCIGFGYKASSQEFKVVKFFYDPIGNKKCSKVFILGTGEWREVRSPPYRVGWGDAPFLHEALHLLHYRGDSYTICAFDIESEEYKEILVPECLGDGLKCYQLTELGGSLYLVQKHVNLAQQHVTLWLLKDYKNQEWVKDYSIDLSLVTSYSLKISEVKPLRILGDGGILLHVWGRWYQIDFGWQELNDLVCYHPQDRVVLHKMDKCNSGVLYADGFKSLRR